MVFFFLQINDQLKRLDNHRLSVSSFGFFEVGSDKVVLSLASLQ